MIAFLLAILAAPDFATGHLLVKPRADMRIHAQSVDAQVAQTFASGWQLWVLPEDWPVEQAAEDLQASGLVERAEPDVIQRIDVVPNDTYATTQQWAWPRIQAFEAWERTTGSANVLVAVVDTGAALAHPDLAANLVPGYDFRNDDVDPTDDNGHGTHVAGTIGAVTDNNSGVAGVNWHVSIMPLKFLGPCGSGLTSDAIQAIDYARQHGVSIINASWGCSGASCYSQALYDAISMEPRMLFVAAAGNRGEDGDTMPHYPAGYDLPNIVSVAASDSSDGRPAFSNWGPLSVDIAAPGTGIFSTYDCTPAKQCGWAQGYAGLSGTSMAAPHVAGVAALVKGLHPGWDWRGLRVALQVGVDPLANWQGVVRWSGRLNARKTVCFQAGC